MLTELNSVLDLIYPRRCPVCDGIVGMFEFRNGRIKRAGLAHRDCLKKIEYVKEPTCVKCGKPLKRNSTDEYCRDCLRTKHLFTRGYSVFVYRTISGSIYRFKYMGRKEYADFYGWATQKRLGKKLKSLGIEAIVPVPMYRDKERKRGYNQAEVYARAVSRALDIPLETGLIKGSEIPLQ